MKLKTELFVLCDYATIDRGNKLSINGIFDHLEVKDLPAAHPSMYLALVFRGEPKKEYQIEIEVIAPEGSSSNYEKQTGVIKPGENGKFNLISQMIGFPISVVGDYKLVIKTGDELVGELEFGVDKVVSSEQSRIRPN